MALVSDTPVIERACIAGEQPLELLFCHDTAREERVPLLFVHGGYVGAWCWEDGFLPWFAARGFPVYALSLRGHGGSGDRANLHSYRITDYAEDVAAVIAHLPRRPVLVGHSMGAVVVQKYLERPNASAAALALLCPVPPLGLLSATWPMALSRPALFAEMSSLAAGGRFSREAARQALFGGPVDPERFNACFARMQPESRRALLDLSGLDLPQRWRVNLPQTLVLGAERDALIPGYLTQSAALTLNAPYREVSGLGHAMMLEGEWQRAAQPLFDWMEEVGL